MNEKLTVALTGGVGSGKSRILDLLRKKFRAEVIQTDHVARMLEEPGQAGFDALVGAFGRELAGEDGRLKKDVLAAMVFTDREARETVNRLIHPLVWQQVQELAGKAEKSFVVVESALVLENPGDFFDEIWYVYTLREERIRRLQEGRGYSRERCLQMMAGQPSEEEYQKCADWVIDNNGSLESVREQIEKRIGDKGRG